MVTEALVDSVLLFCPPDLRGLLWLVLLLLDLGMELSLGMEGVIIRCPQLLNQTKICRNQSYIRPHFCDKSDQNRTEMR